MDNCKDEHMSEAGILTVDLGKFESVDALLCAYENLEREFTRKSQRLAELEKDKDNSDNCDETGSEQPEETEEEGTSERTVMSHKEEKASGTSPTISSDSTAEEQIKVLAEEDKPKAQEVSGEELIEIAVQSETVRDRIISEYLQSLAVNNGVRILSGRIGATALTPVERPRTLREAKAVADKLMRG